MLCLGDRAVWCGRGRRRRGTTLLALLLQLLHLGRQRPNRLLQARHLLHVLSYHCHERLCAPPSLPHSHTDLGLGQSHLGPQSLILLRQRLGRRAALLAGALAEQVEGYTERTGGESSRPAPGWAARLGPAPLLPALSMSTARTAP
jgi:hypothetical protein